MYHMRLYLSALDLVLRDLPSFMGNIPGFWCELALQVCWFSYIHADDGKWEI